MEFDYSDEEYSSEKDGEDDEAEIVERLRDPLGWWSQNERMYPHIAELARKYLEVQASSALSEPLFSHAGFSLQTRVNS